MNNSIDMLFQIIVSEIVINKGHNFLNNKYQSLPYKKMTNNIEKLDVGGGDVDSLENMLLYIFIFLQEQ